MPETQINPQQKQAIIHGQGPMIVVAGAGTGKTTVITERIKFLNTINIQILTPMLYFSQFKLFTLRSNEPTVR